MATYPSSVISGGATAGDIKNLSDDVVAQLWKKTVDVFEQDDDFLQKHEGASSDSVIQSHTDLKADGGSTVHFRNRAGFYDEAHEGPELFEDGDHYEGIKMNSYPVTIDFIRHGIRHTERADQNLGIRGELTTGTARELGKWMGREKTWRAFMTWLHRGNVENTIYAGGKLSSDGLVSADTLSWDEIVQAGYVMKNRNGLPARFGTGRGGDKIFRTMVIPTTDSMYSLKNDPTYDTKVSGSATREGKNPLFSGDIVDVDGHFIKEYNPIYHDGYGPVGSPLNPQARLGVAIAAGTTAVAITGGGSAAAAAMERKKYFRFFPNYAYRLCYIDVVDISSPVTFYVAIYNPPGSSVAPGKFGFYKCTTNDGNNLTMTERLGPVATGIANTTVGGVTYDSAIHTNQHPSNAQIFLVNSKMVPITRTIFAGQRSLLRAYGMYRNQRMTDSKEGGFVKEAYIASVFNQVPRKDADLRCPGHLVLVSACSIPGVPFPNVT